MNPTDIQSTEPMKIIVTCKHLIECKNYKQRNKIVKI